ncbi:hypothetical protein SAMN06297229_0177 [Pseudidiomarina planktonica]|uniref:Uncharacterized protein n=1 Tax=Pseudidiomarina planktonica TaxID=1323738 RepID=A0A1Y6EDZ1_9GAMM|nr:hypothetical protein SAMN06297229_0177 [Pseudidiomarina planktonica]
MLGRQSQAIKHNRLFISAFLNESSRIRHDETFIFSYIYNLLVTLGYKFIANVFKLCCSSSARSNDRAVLNCYI